VTKTTPPEGDSPLFLPPLAFLPRFVTIGPVMARNILSQIVISLLFLPVFCGLTGSVLADSPPESDLPAFRAVHIGLAGAHKLGRWNRATVELSRPLRAGETLQLICQDDQGTPSRVELPAIETTGTRAALFFRPGSGESPLRIIWRDAAGASLTSATGLPGPTAVGSINAKGEFSFSPYVALTRPIYLQLGTRNLGFASHLEGVPLAQQPAVVQLRELAHFPSHALALDAFDVVLFSPTHPRQLRKQQWLALENWVRRGGRLVLNLSPLALEKRAAEEGVTDAMPLSLVGVPATLVSDPVEKIEHPSVLPALLDYTESNVPLAYKQFGDIPVALFNLHVGEALTHSEQYAKMPFVCRFLAGFGSIVVTTSDLFEAPISNWGDRGKLVAKLAGFQLIGTQSIAPEASRIDLGYHDLAGHLRSELDKFPQAPQIPQWLIWVGLLLFLLLLGPGNWLVFRHAPRAKVALFFLFFTVTVALFVLLPWWWITSQSPPSGQLLNQAELLDVDMRSGDVVVHSWSSLYTSSPHRCEVAVQPTKLGMTQGQTDCQTSWFGLAGKSLGGMESTNAPAFASERAWDYNEQLDRLNAVPLAGYATRQFKTSWQGKLNTKLNFGRLQRDKKLMNLNGTIRNPLTVPMQKVCVFYRGRIYNIGELKPGKEFTLEITTHSIDAYSFLKQDEKGKPNYRRDTASAASILRMLAFYRLVAGDGTLGVRNTGTERLDASGILSDRRALLLFELPGDASVLRWEFPATLEKSTTLCRFLFEMD